MNLKAIIFDLDGVITNTAEYHYLAWQRLADEEGLPFDRARNESLRGLARRMSLDRILVGRPSTEEQKIRMMERKNAYYTALLSHISPADLLPGAHDLLCELRAHGIKTGIASASKNCWTVINRLGIAPLVDVVADGNTPGRAKPAPDIFLVVAHELGAAPGACAVVEDATAGIDAALAAGAWAIGIGPETRVGHAHVRFESLDGVTLAGVQKALEEASWTVAESTFDRLQQHYKETIFTSGNGNFCLRGVFEEGYPGENAASFMHEVWDTMPVHNTELANLPRWWGLDIWVNGVRFCLNQGTLLAYRRELDLHTGVLSRSVSWRPDDGGPTVRMRFRRCISLANPHLALVQVQVVVIEGSARIRVRAGISVHVHNTHLLHWDLEGQNQDPALLSVQVRTRATGLRLAAVVAPVFHLPSAVEATEAVCDADGMPFVERQVDLGPNESLTAEKYVALVAGDADSNVLTGATEIVQAAKAGGFSAALSANEAAWARLWQTSDVIIEGDIEAQIALRFNVFQLLIAAPQYTERASIGAKTLSGYGYRHHVFWDTEIFMLPLFTFTQPAIARNMLMYRWHNLPAARDKARAGGYEGAQFPWESAADGREVTPTWVRSAADPSALVRIWTSDIELHITADIAYGVMQYWRVSGDDDFMRDYGAELVLDGAAFWASAAQQEQDGRYHYRNVIGPDEYHDRVDDNAFTNYLAHWHIAAALQVLAWLRDNHPARASTLIETLGLTDQRLAHWRDVVARLHLPIRPQTGLIEQFAGFFALADANQPLLRDPQRVRSMQALLGIEGCAQTQTLKQPDVLMLQFLLSELFTRDVIRANYEYYNPRTDHEFGSSLGPSISAIVACRAGFSADAYEHFVRCARADLFDVRGNARDGIHGASAGGHWQAVVLGLAGLQTSADGWTTHAALPPGWTRLAFKFYWRGRLESVDIHA